MRAADRVIPRLKILLVEDNIDNLNLARHILEKAGFAVDTALNGREAVTAVRRHRYELILMDIQMPEMDGFEATGLIRAMESERGVGRTPIIALTALTVKGLREKCLERGFDDYLSKPINATELIEALDRWTGWRPTVLVVDDVEDNRRLIEEYLLRDDRYKAVFANNGIEAITAFKKQLISLIFLDMEMPRMDGYTAARIIRKLEGKPLIPIIAMTAHEGPEEIRKCLKMGCTGYIGKPINESELLAVVHEYLPREKALGRDAKREGQIVINAVPDLADLIPGYLENRRRDVKEIQRLLREGNFGEILKLGHSMKGSGGGYGCDEITLIGEAIEEAAVEGDKDAVSELNERLSRYLARVKIVSGTISKV